MSTKRRHPILLTLTFVVGMSVLLGLLEVMKVGLMVWHGIAGG